MPARVRQPKITQSDLNRLRGLAAAFNLKIAAIEMTPTCVRLVATNGRELTAPEDDGNLDRELAEHRARYGDGAA